MLKIIAFITLLSFSIQAQEPTIVYGESTLPDGKKDSLLIMQPKNSPNPLGDPIIYNPPNNSQQQANDIENSVQKNQPLKMTNQINQSAEQNPPPFSKTPQELNNEIENTLYQGGDRIYDIQSYPIKDINKITEPNIDPTISTYPEY